jgi:hypothetical protein
LVPLLNVGIHHARLSFMLRILALLPAVMAGAYDNCDRPDALWASWDQGYGRSYTYGGTASGDFIYLLGRASGNLSMATKHKTGTYTDHEGSSATHDTLEQMTIHHHTDTCCGGTCCDGGQSPESTQHGMDTLIYKLTKDGAPVSVFGIDTMPVDGITNGITNDPSKNITGGSVNGGSGGYSYFPGIDSFEKSGNPTHMAIAGRHRGRLSFRQADGTLRHFDNAKMGMRSNGWGYNAAVAKIDMENDAVAWVTSEGMMLEDERTSAEAVATTADGHVIAAGEKRGDAGGQFIVKFAGADGALVWSKTYPELDDLVHMTADGEIGYVTGKFKGNSSDSFNGLSGLTSCKSGDDDSAFIMAFDAAPAAGPAFTWMTMIGCGQGYSVRAEGDYLYVAGYLDEEATTVTTTPAPAGGQGSCALTGEFGGYLAKISKTDGKCVWAKDTPRIRRAVTDGNAVWTAYYDNDAVKFDATHSLAPNGDQNDMFVAKYSASDGTPHWASAMGGIGREYAYDATMTSNGPVFLGYSDSPSFTMGSVEIHSLQHDYTGKTEAERGSYGMFALALGKTDVRPSCITACDSGDVTAADTVIETGKCYADNTCLAVGDFSPVRQCFRCDATSQSILTGPIHTDHCYFNNVCMPRGTLAPSYKRYNSDSVCEQCDPDVNPNGWSVKPGFFHDRDYANDLDCGRGSRSDPGACAPNNYGILFQLNTGGCQILPDVPMPASSSIPANPTSDTSIAAVGARVTSAFAALDGATAANQGAEIVSAWYHGNPATCTKAADNCASAENSAKDVGEACVHSDVCKNTPASHADAMALLFETNMHYGHSIARIKVMQALAILQNDLATGTTTADKEEIKKDIIAHMLVPMYQGAIEAAHRMDDPASQAVGLADFSAYWSIIKGKVAFADAKDKTRLDALSEAAGTNNFCQVHAILARNLPSSSKLQYSHDWVPSSTASTDVNHLKATVQEEAVHLDFDSDIGVLAARKDANNEQLGCVYPLPSPPPAPPPSPLSPPVKEASASSGLSEGEIAGVAVGAAVGGIVVLLAIGLILRSLLVRDAKPVFTCLEKAPADKKGPPV